MKLYYKFESIYYKRIRVRDHRCVIRDKVLSLLPPNQKDRQIPFLFLFFFLHKMYVFFFDPILDPFLSDLQTYCRFFPPEPEPAVPEGSNYVLLGLGWDCLQ